MHSSVETQAASGIRGVDPSAAIQRSSSKARRSQRQGQTHHRRNSDRPQPAPRLRRHHLRTRGLRWPRGASRLPEASSQGVLVTAGSGRQLWGGFDKSTPKRQARGPRGGSCQFCSRAAGGGGRGHGLRALMWVAHGDLTPSNILLRHRNTHIVRRCTATLHCFEGPR
jgi:hypothetical protein